MSFACSLTSHLLFLCFCFQFAVSSSRERAKKRFLALAVLSEHPRSTAWHPQNETGFGVGKSRCEEIRFCSIINGFDRINSAAERVQEDSIWRLAKRTERKFLRNPNLHVGAA
jgi:hypothetical protein